MIPAYRSCHTCRDGNDHQSLVCLCKNRNDNRNQNSKSAPGSSRSKCQKASDQENDRRKEVHQSFRKLIHTHCNKRCRSETVCHRFQGPCKCQDHNCRNHRLKSFRNAFHTLFKSQNLPDTVQPNRKNEAKEASEDKSHRRVTVRERCYKINPVKKSSGIDHADYTANDQRCNRNQKICHFPIFIDRNFLPTLVRSVRSCKDISFYCIFLMCPHCPKIKFHHNNRNHHQNRQ